MTRKIVLIYLQTDHIHIPTFAHGTPIFVVVMIIWLLLVVWVFLRKGLSLSWAVLLNFSVTVVF